MREFNAFEKETITLIAKIKLESNEAFPRFLQENFFTVKRKQALIVKHDTQDVLFYMSPKVFANENERAKAIKNFWTLISLIEYLIEQRYITNIPVKDRKGIDFMYKEFDSIKAKGSKIILNNQGDYLLASSPDRILDSTGKEKLRGIIWNDLYQSISNNLLGIIYPSEGLKYLVRNNFQSEEDKRYYSQLRLTWLGIIISAVLGGYSIWSDINNSADDKGFKVKLNDEINSIKIEAEKINNNIESGIDTIATEIIELNESLINIGSKDYKILHNN